jgi:hypothetical protein
MMDPTTQKLFEMLPAPKQQSSTVQTLSSALRNTETKVVLIRNDDSDEKSDEEEDQEEVN